MDIVERQIQRTKMSEVKRIMQQYPKEDAENIIRLILLGFGTEMAMHINGGNKYGY